MELRHLRYFVAVAEELHFRRAAERLHISQPPLSLQIADLERELGAKLFERSSQRVSLTDAGRLFLDSSRQIFSTLEKARRDVQLAGEGLAGELRIGFTQSSEFLDLLPEAISRHRRINPAISFSLRQMRTADQIAAVAARELDLGITRKPAGTQPRDVELIRLRDDPLVLAVHEDHPLAKVQSASVRDLRSLPLIVQPADSASGLREIVLSLCRRARLAPAVVQEAREVLTILGLVAAQVGVAIVPSSSKRISIGSLRFVPLTDPEAKTPLFMCVGRRHGSRMVDTFGALLLQMANDATAD